MSLSDKIWDRVNEMKRVGIKPNCLYLGSEEYVQLARDVQCFGQQSPVPRRTYAGMQVFCLDASSHIGVAFNP